MNQFNMVRTSSVGIKISSGKSSKKTGSSSRGGNNSATRTGGNSSSKGSSRLPPIPHKETPAWQKPITNFFNSGPCSSKREDNCNGSESEEKSEFPNHQVKDGQTKSSEKYEINAAYSENCKNIDMTDNEEKVFESSKMGNIENDGRETKDDKTEPTCEISQHENGDNQTVKIRKENETKYDLEKSQKDNVEGSVDSRVIGETESITKEIEDGEPEIKKRLITKN